jgi:Ca2+-binding RTX toxin-like protein
MLFNGANIAEKIDISANGQRVRFIRDIASIVMDLNDVEGVTFVALAGADEMTVNDLTGTDLVDVLFQLNADGAADTVIVNATNGDDIVDVTADASGMQVNGLSAVVRVTGAEVANDRLVVAGQDGDDVIDVSDVPAGQPVVEAQGGNGDDALIGGVGTNILRGEDGDDVLVRGTGTAVAEGGNGSNVIL